MYIFKNAVKSITRSKGRNILIGFIIVIIATASCVALSIKNSAVELVQSYKDSFELTATIGVDRDALRNNAQTAGSDMREIMNSIPAITLDQIKSYGDSDYLNGYTYQLSSSVNSSSLTALSNNTPVPTSGASGNNANGGSDSGNGMKMPDRGGFGVGNGDFTIVGYSGMSAMSEFVDGTYKITSGAMFDDNEATPVCVISKELADENKVAVGDKISLTNPNNEKETYEFTIVGLYSDSSTDSSTSMNWFSNSANQIITSYTALSNIIESSKTASTVASTTTATTTATATAATTATDAAADTDTDTTSSTALSSRLSSTFFLKDETSVEPFAAELKTKGLNEYYTVTTNEDSFTTNVEPITNLNNFATLFLVLVLLIGGLIMFVLNMINIRERKYEVGVLRAIGMKKGKLALQFVCELLMVTFLSIIIGSSVGAVVSVPTANMLLAKEVSNLESSTTDMAKNFGRPDGTGMDMSARGGAPGSSGTTATAPQGGGKNMMGMFGSRGKADYVTQINAVINLKVLFELFGIGILLTIFSSIISIILISRYEPLKILSSRS